MGTWMNDDGLFIKYGRDRGTTKKAGEFEDFPKGNEHYIEAQLDLETLGTSTGTVFLSDTLRLPATAYLLRAEIFVETAFTSGGSATLTLGLYDTDRTTAYDADGIDATVAVAALTAGATITCDGALINTRLANNTPCLLSATVGTAAFTAGKGFLRVWYKV